MNRIDPVLDASVTDPLESFRRAKPQIGGPNLHAELTPQEAGRESASASEVEDAHAGPEVQLFGEPLDQPQRVGAAAHAGRDPVRVIRRRAGKPLGEKTRVR